MFPFHLRGSHDDMHALSNGNFTAVFGNRRLRSARQNPHIKIRTEFQAGGKESAQSDKDRNEYEGKVFCSKVCDSVHSF